LEIWHTWGGGEGAEATESDGATKRRSDEGKVSALDPLLP
jgi:hypothetical protein